MLQQVMSQIAAVKKDMIILEKSEFSTLLAENEVGAFPFAGAVAQKSRCVGALCCFCGEPLFLVFSFFFFSFISQKLKLQLFQLSVQLAVGLFYFTPSSIRCVLCCHFIQGKTFCVEQCFVYRLFV